MIDSIYKYITGLLKIKGGTDGTVIGNTGNSLNVSVTNNNDAVEKAMLNLKTLEMLGRDLDGFVITDEDELVITSTGSLVREE